MTVLMFVAILVVSLILLAVNITAARRTTARAGHAAEQLDDIAALLRITAARAAEQLDDIAALLRITAARGEPAPGELDEPSRIVRGLFRENVVATLKSGETFAGVLVAADAHALVLREAVQLATADRAPVDGELIVPRADIAYLQRP